MKKTQLMGILNVTPDSAYDQGRYFDSVKAIERGLQIWQEKADWIDIGGESTRPKAVPVPEEEELRRVLPVIKALKSEVSIPLSIDTMKARVADAAIQAGASLINDVSGFRHPEMRQLAASSQLPICLMHMYDTPVHMQDNPVYEEGVVPFLLDWFKQRIDLLLNCGVKEGNIIIDPGIGFGKTVDDNVSIINNLHQFKALGFPVLIGLSRKSFLGKIVGKTYPDLLAVSLAANCLAVHAQVEMIRGHDVHELRDIIDLVTYFEHSKGKS